MEQVELIHRCQQGDRQAMGLLYTDMHDELLDICRHYVNDSATAEDLLHDSFLLIFSKIGDFVEPSVNYYFQRKNDIETWRTLHPFTFSLPLGVRITLP